MEKRNLSFWEIWNMSFGFMGIQFGWGLQMANMSPIYEYLGAQPEEIPMLWLAAPLTGLVVQPIIGAWSDKTWTRLGRRKPFFLVGAILSSIALVFMPNSTALWMAAGLLWILDASINVSMEPFRAFVVDMLPEKQHSKGFAMQSFMIGVGAVVASALPWLLGNVFGVVNDPEAGGIPATVKWSFYLGAVAFLGAVLWTVFKTKPHPPTEDELAAMQESKGVVEVAKEVWHGITNMPSVMKRVALVQFFTWPGLFLMWFYYSSAVAVDVFEAAPASPEYTEGVEFAGLTLAFYNLVTFLFALALPKMASTLGKRMTHACVPAHGGGRLDVGQRGSERVVVVRVHDRCGCGLGEHPLHALRHAGSKFASGQSRLVHGHLQFFHRVARDHRFSRIWLVDGAPVERQSDGRGDDWGRPDGACCVAFIPRSGERGCGKTVTGNKQLKAVFN